MLGFIIMIILLVIEFFKIKYFDNYKIEFIFDIMRKFGEYFLFFKIKLIFKLKNFKVG